MSSEGSVLSEGSRIRQFGLYRTIDARTEEFLRSSRKRQIRQGCACAAISTAITVTVVISVVLLYEYSTNLQSNANKINFGLMNGTETARYDYKLTKKINFDRTTLKLIPILLKALTKNKYLENIIEEYSSSPPNDRRDSTETTYKKNIFTRPKKWHRVPKWNANNYKKIQVQRNEYLRKLREMRDFERILNYFDKMINYRVGYESKRELESVTASSILQKPPKDKSIINEDHNIQVRSQTTTQPFDIIPKINHSDIKCSEQTKENVACKCSLKVGVFLRKLIRNIENIIPEMISKSLRNIVCEKITKLNLTKPIEPCPKKALNKIIKSSKSRQLKTPTLHSNTKSKINLSPNTKANSTLLSKKMLPSKNLTSLHSRINSAYLPQSKTTDFHYQTFEHIKDSLYDPTQSTPTSTTTETSSIPMINENHYSDQNVTTLLPGIVSTSLEMLNNTSTTAQIMTNSESINTYALEETITTTDISLPPTFFDKPATITNKQGQLLSPSTEVVLDRLQELMPGFKDEEYEDYNINLNDTDDLKFEQTTDLLNLPVNHSNFENNLRKVQNDNLSKNVHYIAPNQELDTIMADLVHESNPNYSKEVTTNSVKKADNKIYYTNQITPKSPTTSKRGNAHSSVQKYISKDIGHEKNQFKNENNAEKLEYKFGIHQTGIDDTFNDEFQDEFIQMDSTIETPKLNDEYQQLIKHSTTLSLKNDEKTNPSMLPSIRPTYLKILRNTHWKQPDQPDEVAYYDNNFNIFDFPDI